MGSNLVRDAPPRHVVSIEHDMRTRGWERASISRGLHITYVSSAPVPVTADDGADTEIPLTEERYDAPSLAHRNGWAVLVHWADRFPSGSGTFVTLGSDRTSGSRATDSVLDCAGRSAVEIARWVRERAHEFDGHVSVVMENRRLVVATKLSEHEDAMVAWAVRVDLMPDTAIDSIGSDAGVGERRASAPSKRPMHENVPIVIIRDRRTPDSVDAIVCESKAVRIKYENIYLHEMRVRVR